MKTPQELFTPTLTRLFGLSVLLGLTGSVIGCTPPPKIAVVAFLDCSASFEAQRPQSVDFLKVVQKELEPDRDQITVFRLADEVHWLYANHKAGPRKFGEALEHYLGVAPGRTGTAMGDAFQRGLDEADIAAKAGLIPHVLMLGDAEDEKTPNGHNMNAEAVKQAYKRFPPQGHLYLLFINPKPGDRLRELLRPVLGERLHLFTPEACANQTAWSQIRRVMKGQ